MELVHALRTIYNLSLPLAVVLSLVAILLCGNGLKVSLHDLAQHNKIEHDGSLAHDDCLPGHRFARWTPNLRLVQNLLCRAAPGHGLSLNDFARARADCESKLRSPLDALHEQVALGESALTWLTMKDQRGEVPLDMAKQWYGEERLPEGYVRPEKPVGLFLVHGISSDVGKRMKKLLSPAA
jgi:hypothetical protein